MTGMPELKYSIRDFQGSNIEQKSLNVLIAMANELHNIYSILWEMKESEQSKK